MSEYDKLELKDKDGNVLIKLETPVGSISPVKVATVWQYGFSPVGSCRHIVSNEDLEGFAICLLSVLGYKIR